MFLPCVMQVLCMTWYIQVNIVRIFKIFVSWINGQEEYCPSSARIVLDVVQKSQYVQDLDVLCLWTQ